MGGEGESGARGAGPGRGLGAAPPAKLLAGAASGRAVRAGASRLWPRPLSSPGAAVALGGCERAAAARRRWPLEPTCEVDDDGGTGTAAVVGLAPSRLQVPGCRVRTAPGAAAGWDGKIAARERSVSAGARRGSLERVRGREGGARPRPWGSAAARARAARASPGSTLLPAWARTAPRRTCAARRASEFQGQR